jgi:uncharacterized protein YuzE
VAEKKTVEKLKARYDAKEDTLYLTFTQRAHQAVAEEIGDEVFVRYDPDTRDIVDIEFLNFSARLEELFGKDVKFSELPREERLLFPIR